MSVRIERVVLTNVALEPREADAFRGTVESELARLVAEGGLPAAAGGDRLVELRAAVTPFDVARAIYDTLGKAD